MGPYRTASPPAPIRDGHYDDWNELAREVKRASELLGLSVISADRPKDMLIGFVVGDYRWTIHWRAALKTCPRLIWHYLPTQEGRRLLARELTLV